MKMNEKQFHVECEFERETKKKERESKKFMLCEVVAAVAVSTTARNEHVEMCSIKNKFTNV